MGDDKNIYMYFHAGSKNHGCEAIVRSSAKLLDDQITLISASASEDIKYKVDDLVSVVEKPSVKFSTAEKIQMKLSRSNQEKIGYRMRAKREAALIPPGSVALSVGGDNYCYGAAYNYYLEGMNTLLHRKGCKTVLWGCSIEPSDVTPEMKIDFAQYDLITARESISYRFLQECNPNTLLVCDSAFCLETEHRELPDLFVDGKTIGVNLSPLIQKSETIKGITFKNYEQMIAYIIDETDYQIALIPHVVCDGNDDRVPLKELYDVFKETGRVCLIDDCNCEQLKGYISCCEMFIGARTHATIAAYSSYVPTLVVGYSTKAKGIAVDLFGTDQDYVVPVQSLKHSDDMSHSFEWLNLHRDEIRTHLHQVMPEYTKRVENGLQALRTL